jgi:catechol 2,3-dioxygenase-like lactoylglutathione lyase family enzyme
VGFVYRDLARAVALYTPLFGPFTYLDAVVEGARYRGEPADVSMQLAFGKSGDIEIELIQIIAGRSPHQEFIDAGREGMHHLRFRADDCDRWIARLEPLGYRAIWYKAWPELGNCKACYFERDRDPLLIELFERNW